MQESWQMRCSNLGNQVCVAHIGAINAASDLSNKEVFNKIQAIYGVCDIDLFASKHNKQLPRYIIQIFHPFCLYMLLLQYYPCTTLHGSLLK
jgi:hypothetical protein